MSPSSPRSGVVDAVRRIGTQTLDAIRGDRLVRAAAFEVPDGPLWVAGVGKASVSMAAGLEARFGERVVGGLVITKEGDKSRLERCEVLEAPHPVPGLGSLAAGRRMLEFARSRGAGDTVVFCLSGGASAMMDSLVPGIELSDLQETNRVLLASGAPIHVLNAVRRQLSEVKAGGLARRFAPASVTCLVMSDVEGDDFRVIGSGPLWQASYDVQLDASLVKQLPVPVQARLGRSQGLDSDSVRVPHVLVGNRETAYEAAAAIAQREGFLVRRFATPIVGEARDVGRALAREVLDSAPGTCLLGVGETTVTLRRSGRGGRCQELACAAAQVLSLGVEEVGLAALGTDGSDGPTDAAGAWCDSSTWGRAAAAGFSGATALEEHESYGFHVAANTLWKTGPTGSNLNDLLIGIRG